MVGALSQLTFDSVYGDVVGVVVTCVGQEDLIHVSCYTLCQPIVLSLYNISLLARIDETYRREGQFKLIIQDRNLGSSIYGVTSILVTHAITQWSNLARL